MPQSNSVRINQAAIAEYAKPEFMEYLDDAMSNQHFIPTDLVPLWDAGAPEDIARAAFYSYQPSDPRVDGGLGYDPSTPTMPDLQQMGRTSTSMSLPVHMPQTQQPLSLPQQQQQHTQQGIVQTPLNTEDNLPPWLWPTNGSPDILRMPNMGGEDLDVNMDDGFDWQTWQESLGRYEVEANGGRAGSTWGPGL